jgi:hypothetical protein
MQPWLANTCIYIYGIPPCMHSAILHFYHHACCIYGLIEDWRSTNRIDLAGIFYVHYFKMDFFKLQSQKSRPYYVCYIFIYQSLLVILILFMWSAFFVRLFNYIYLYTTPFFFNFFLFGNFLYVS